MLTITLYLLRRQCVRHLEMWDGAGYTDIQTKTDVGAVSKKNIYAILVTIFHITGRSHPSSLNMMYCMSFLDSPSVQAIISQMGLSSV